MRTKPANASTDSPELARAKKRLGTWFQMLPEGADPVRVAAWMDKGKPIYEAAQLALLEAAGEIVTKTAGPTAGAVSMRPSARRM